MAAGVGAMRDFLLIATRRLQRPFQSEPSNQTSAQPQLRSWCAVATFNSIAFGAEYFNAELPTEDDLMENHTRDGGSWVQWGPIGYDKIAHIIIPHSFYEEHGRGHTFVCWTHKQDIAGLSELLSKARIEHHLSDYALEIKRF
jgi:hypothetical protein